MQQHRQPIFLTPRNLILFCSVHNRLRVFCRLSKETSYGRNAGKYAIADITTSGSCSSASSTNSSSASYTIYPESSSNSCSHSSDSASSTSTAFRCFSHSSDSAFGTESNGNSKSLRIVNTKSTSSNRKFSSSDWAS